MTIGRPIDEMLRNAAARTSGHMPGHRGHAPFEAADLYALDTTELPVTDDLYAASGAILRAEQLYADAAGSAACVFLHNGSTCGNHVMLQLYAGPGDTVLLPRNAHLSAVNACTIGGLRPVWMPVTQEADGYCHVTEETVLATIAGHPEAKALLLTRPDYYGCAMPLCRIVEEAHRRGIRVVIDEAHGAHYPWLEEIPSAGACGADAWVQSVHKTVLGLTACAVLHLRDAAYREAALRILRREQTSSPSFILMRAIDDSRAWMQMYGREKLNRLSAEIGQLRKKLPEWGYGDAYAGWEKLGLQCDPVRLVISAPQGGYTLAAALADQGIDVEMADDRRVVLILGPDTDPQDLERIGSVLASVKPETVPLTDTPDVTALPERRMDVRDAVFAACERVPLALAKGRIAVEPAGLYPPGIPQVMPGEIIPETVIKMLQEAGEDRCFGVEGDCLLCVKP